MLEARLKKKSDSAPNLRDFPSGSMSTRRDSMPPATSAFPSWVIEYSFINLNARLKQIGEGDAQKYLDTRKELLFARIDQDVYEFINAQETHFQCECTLPYSSSVHADFILSGDYSTCKEMKIIGIIIDNKNEPVSLVFSDGSNKFCVNADNYLEEINLENFGDNVFTDTVLLQEVVLRKPSLELPAMFAVEGVCRRSSRDKHSSPSSSIVTTAGPSRAASRNSLQE